MTEARAMESKTWFMANLDGEKGESLLHTIESNVVKSDEFGKLIR